MKRLLIACALVMAAGCASVRTPPSELVDAREEYRSASIGDAPRLVPSAFRRAKKALDTAERTFANEGDTPSTRDWAYIAHREILKAEVAAMTAYHRLVIAAAKVFAEDHQKRHEIKTPR
jgi:hypothetical protein